MLQGKKTRKIVAATLLSIMLTNTFAPGISYALTSGPTQPEATSFEPIDTTDMVNAQTGDMTYNIPLTEVPGPDGSYPLALSYHAGIQPNEDANWVGLGWSLNAGAINRTVNGFPDDWYTPSTSTRYFWEGGTQKTYDVGVSIGIANTPATVSFGLSFSQDTYRGFGVGSYMGIGGSLGPFNASITLGSSPYGGGYLSGGIGIQVFGSPNGGLNGSVGLGFTTNFQSLQVGVTGGIGYSLGQNGSGQHLGGSLLGVTLSTDGGRPSLAVGGFSTSVNNANAGKISTSSHGFHIDIPVYYGINLSLGYSKTRYWTDETTSVNTHGSLWPNGWGGTGNSYGGVSDAGAYDEYSLLEDPSYSNIVDNPDPTKEQGGAFPEYDVYSVNAQGLGGNMRPYMFQGGIVGQNINNGSTPVVTYCSPGVTDNPPVFRFEDDFSNSYRQNNAAFYNDPSLNLRLVAPPFDANPVYGNNDGSYGYAGANSLAGSKYVNTTLQVQPTSSLGYSQSERYSSGMIAGFSITNETGVSYHFGLPAYSYGEENTQQLIDQSNKVSLNRESRPNPYAYTWYLTTITGPDYVDRNGNGVADDGDWGYWVNFEYGKWSDDYVWRNPSEGYTKDEDNTFQDCSIGHREIYYLNAIRTRSHVAIFEKTVRLDAKGESPSVFGQDPNNKSYVLAGYFDNTSVQSLQLSHIYLLNASDANFVGTGAGPSPNTIDKEDVDAAGRSALEAKALRVIDFNYDNSLCPGTTNSFDYSNPSIKSGKLTLNSLVTRGKGGANLLPALQFSYDLSSADQNTQTGVSMSAGSFSTTNGNFVKGDLIMMSGSPNVYCGVISSVSQSGSTYTYSLTNSSYTAGTTTATVYRTKNPPYNKDFYDEWGMYMSDINLTTVSKNENQGRITTPVSAKGADAWSLRTISSPLGDVIKIGYESDQLISSVLDNKYPYIITSPTLIGNPMYVSNVITFKVNTNGYPLSSILNVGDGGKIILLPQYDDTGQLFYVPFKSTYTVTAIDADGTVHATLSTSIPNGAGYGPYSGNLEALATGNISAVNTTGLYGGGIRISSITEIAGDGSQNITTYNYNNPATGVTSGVTSYLPSVLDVWDGNVLSGTSGPGAYLSNYKRLLYSDASSLYSLARELPSPGVMYQYATVSDYTQAADESTPRKLGSTQYQFKVFNTNMVGRLDIPVSSSYGTTTGRTKAVTNWGTMTTHTLSLMAFTGEIGQVQRIQKFDNNGKVLNETINHFLDDGLEGLSLSDFMTQYKARLAQYFYQGYLQEHYSEVKVVNEQGWTSASQVMSTLSTREAYPSIQTGQTVANYVNGTQTTSQNQGFDFYSGAVTQTLETDAYGNNFQTLTIPAYHKYPGMGLMMTSPSNKNMLTQTGETYMWSVDGSNNRLGLVSASATTWTNGLTALATDGTSHIQDGRSENISGTYYPNGNVWRQQSTYNWQPTTQATNGLTDPASFAEFNWTTPSASDARWVNSTNITLYDVYSKALEATDVNGNYQATHLNYGDRKVILSGGPANYYELAYSGAEDAGVNQTSPLFVQAADGTLASGVSHTGAQSLLLGTSGKKGFLYSAHIVSSGPGGEIAGKAYAASVWVKTGKRHDVGSQAILQCRWHSKGQLVRNKRQDRGQLDPGQSEHQRQRPGSGIDAGRMVRK